MTKFQQISSSVVVPTIRPSLEGSVTLIAVQPPCGPPQDKCEIRFNSP